MENYFTKEVLSRKGGVAMMFIGFLFGYGSSSYWYAIIIVFIPIVSYFGDLIFYKIKKNNENTKPRN